MIRPATASDLPALREVFRRSSLANPDDRPLLTAHPELLELEDAAVMEGRTHVAVENGRVVGFASLVVGSDALELEDLFVDPECMRHGIGRALMAAMATAARVAGHEVIEVNANRHALTFYRQVGFVDLHEVELEYGTAIRMRLAIQG